MVTKKLLLKLKDLVGSLRFSPNTTNREGRASMLSRLQDRPDRSIMAELVPTFYVKAKEIFWWRRVWENVYVAL